MNNIEYFEFKSGDLSCAVKVIDGSITDLVDTSKRTLQDKSEGKSWFKHYLRDVYEFEQDFNMNISSGKDGDLSCEKKIISEEDFNEIKMAHRIDDKIRGIHKRRAMFKERNKDHLEEKRKKLLGEVVEYPNDFDHEPPVLVANSVKEWVGAEKDGKVMSRKEKQQEHDEQASLRLKNLKQYYDRKKRDM